MNQALMKTLELVAVESLVRGTLPAVDPRPGVRALDLWRDGTNGAMLFWVDAEADLHGSGEPALCDVYAEMDDRTWRATSSSSATSEPIDEVVTRLPPGLHRVSGGSCGRVFVTWAVATPEVARIQLRDEAGNIQDRAPGAHGFTLLGVTSDDPLTRAYAIDHAGQAFAGEPLTLWAPPRG